jgi:O-methyltransferase involved in polyketide biosynthesis
MDRETITPTGAQETTLATLYGKAIDSRSPNSILRDHQADKAMQRIAYGFRKTGVNATTAAGIALRAKQLDDWTAEFLSDHQQATVLHLACGLDTRVHRLDPPSSVRWFDVDYPEVLDLRKRLLPEPAGDYRMVGASVIDDAWLEQVPDDRPTVAAQGGRQTSHSADHWAVLQWTVALRLLRHTRDPVAEARARGAQRWRDPALGHR